MAVPSRQQVDAMIARALADDPGFRDQLMADPKATLSALVGMPLPDAVVVEVHEESLTGIHLVIPAQATSGELSEDDLELVAGGGTCWDNCGCSI